FCPSPGNLSAQLQGRGSGVTDRSWFFKLSELGQWSAQAHPGMSDQGVSTSDPSEIFPGRLKSDLIT
ncbi:MAG TPA: hypothetical protein VJY33_20735, partial [Isosphaeraceae bacterium]|nr:hypothetical protein [Isosphaeraceae bacterium]